jgi:hypothetical protein
MSRGEIPNEKSNNFSARMRETVMTYLGRQGDPLDRGVTLRDLVESDIVQIDGPVRAAGPVPLTPGTAIPPVDEVDLTPPPVPTGLTVTPGISYLFIQHDSPTFRQGRGYLRTHVYGVVRAPGAPAPTFSDAVEIGQFTGTTYAYPTNPSTTWHIWIKWETNDGVLSPSPAGGTNGVSATTGQDVRLLLEALTGEITESELFSDLGARIDLIDIGPDALVPQVTSIQGKYTVKIDSNGYVSGFGLASTANNATPTSEFAVRADKFYIASPSGPDLPPIVPFIVRTTPTTINGVSVPTGVYIDGAYIQGGSITGASIAGGTIEDAKLINVSANKITGAALTSTAYIESAAYVTGVSGWKIHGDGTAEFAAASIRGQLTASQIDSRGLTIKDASGNIIFGSGTNLSASLVSGLGTLATQNSVTSAQVSGLGTLATQNSVTSAQVSGLGAFATLSQISTTNISTYIAGAAIDTAYIKEAAIKTALIDDLAVNTGKIADLAVNTGKIADLAVNAAKIANATITSAKIGSLQVKSANIDDLTVGTEKITAAAITNTNTFSSTGDNIGLTNTVTYPANSRHIVVFATSGSKTDTVSAGEGSVTVKNPGVLTLNIGGTQFSGSGMVMGVVALTPAESSLNLTCSRAAAGTTWDSNLYVVSMIFKR